MINRNRQQGMTLVGWLLVIGLIAFTTMVVLKLLPIYLQQYAISESMAGLVDNKPDRVVNATSLKDALLRRLDINSVTNIGKDDILVTREGSNYAVSADYEVRVPFVYNIDLVVYFENRVEVPAR